MKCSATGIEISPEYYAIGLQRLQQIKKLETPDLFDGLAQ